MIEVPEVLSRGVNWEQPTENSIEAIRHGMQHLDGVEFDLRITTDDQLVLHHDRKVALESERLEGRPPHPEEWAIDELKDVGFDGFEDLLDDSTFMDHWRSGSKTVCIELKRPHPRVGRTDWHSGRRTTDHLVRMLQRVDEALEPHDLPVGTTVIYAFHGKMTEVGRRASSRHPTASLRPVLLPWGNDLWNRAAAAPSFVLRSFKRLNQLQRTSGAPMLPCALEYLTPPMNRLPLGRHVGLTGRARENLLDLSEGYPRFVWSAPLKRESALLDAGCTPLTDDADPSISTRPDGRLRWPRPLSQPLDPDDLSELRDLPKEEHAHFIQRRTEDQPLWHDLDAAERRSHLQEWRRRWRWKASLDSLDRNDGTVPWEGVRILGHRGAGRTGDH